MPKTPRPSKQTIPQSANTTQILALLRSIEARLTRLETDDDLRAARAAELRKKP